MIVAASTAPSMSRGDVVARKSWPIHVCNEGQVVMPSPFGASIRVTIRVETVVLRDFLIWIVAGLERGPGSLVLE
jgi:hypothetical protein